MEKERSKGAFKREHRDRDDSWESKRPAHHHNNANEKKRNS